MALISLDLVFLLLGKELALRCVSCCHNSLHGVDPACDKLRGCDSSRHPEGADHRAESGGGGGEDQQQSVQPRDKRRLWEDHSSAKTSTCTGAEGKGAAGRK